MMKKTGIVIFAAALFLSACQNPYMVHNLERPVYLTGIEVRSDILAADEPSHPLDQVFQSGHTQYTVTVPYNAEQVVINGFPDEGAALAGDRLRNFDLGQDEITFTLTVLKAHRQSTVYTVKVRRGLPEAVLAGLELYIGDQDPDDTDSYEHDNYIVHFNSYVGIYEVTVPAYTNHLLLTARSLTGEGNRIDGIAYEFKDWEGKTIGADGRTAAPGYRREKDATTVNKGPLPDWYPDQSIPWGDLHIYRGKADYLNPAAPDNDMWFGAGTVTTGDPDPRGKGKVAEITVTASAPGRLNDKVYTIKLQREAGAAFLEGLEIIRITGAGAGSNGDLPKTNGTGTADVIGVDGPNRLVGNFARTIYRYDAALPEDANGVRVNPIPDHHVTNATTVKYKYIPYFFDEGGTRYYIDHLGDHYVHPNQDPPLEPPYYDLSPLSFNIPYVYQTSGPIDLYFDVNDPNFPTAGMNRYVRMEVVIVVEAAAGDFATKIYRVTVRRQKDNAVLNGITVEPHAGVYPGDGNVLGSFNPKVTAYTVNVDAGRTFARIKLDNGVGAISGSANRVIKIISPSQTFTFRKAGGVWVNEFLTSFGSEPWADVELKSRNTTVQIQVTDVPNFSSGEYVLYILSKNSYDIILPLDADSDNDGQVRAVFASGTNAGLNAQYVLPGEGVYLSVNANLGYYIDETKTGWYQVNEDGSLIKDGMNNPVPAPAGQGHYYRRGVYCSAATLAMDSGITQIAETGAAAKSKARTYRFDMPEENVRFRVMYKPTTNAVNATAYVASGARRGGGYGGGDDGRTGKSWGTASNDLQAVINSWSESNRFEAIWVLEGTYIPPEPETYNQPPYIPPDAAPWAGDLNNPFRPGDGPSNYNVTGMNVSSVASKADIGFVLRDRIKIIGGFKETDNDPVTRFTSDAQRDAAAANTVLSGEFPDGTNAHHVVIAAGIAAVTLDTLTISGGIGPETDGANVIVNGSPLYRTRGGGLYNINSSITLDNVVISGNKSTRGGGMYTVSSGGMAISELTNVRFENNTSLESGGGMYNEAASHTNNLHLKDCLFNENKSVDMGGGLYNGDSGGFCNPFVENTRFNSNSAKTGGGIYTSGGSGMSQDDPYLYFLFCSVTDNWTSGNGSGIFNASKARFFDLTVSGNVSKGGSGIGIYNSGSIQITNAAIKNNIDNGATQGGGLYNAGSAVLSNVTITENSADSGGAIYNAGRLTLANGIIKQNTATGSGGGIVNYGNEGTGTTNAAAVTAVLVNVSLTENAAASGGGIYNHYDGSDMNNKLMAGSVNLLLNNALIAENSGGGIYNRYGYYSGRGINLTLNNTTIAGNDGDGVKSVKGGPGQGYPYETVEGVEEPAQNKRAFPVYIRFRNSVVYGNSGDASVWDAGGFGGFTAGNLPGDRETYEYSLLQGKDSLPGNGNLDSSAVTPPVLTGTYRPGSALVNNGSAALYPSGPAALLDQLFWNIGGNDNGIYDLVTGIPVFTGGVTMTNPHINYFLGYDNSFNVGDLRDNGGHEGPKTKTRPGSLDIGAYEQ
ncbi:MAG: right-handed parallel beta-helix repeat-containing protein [Treponema sp.]|jgi:predicted outer membrane repeat protein|nr:right-handed parallel beta-helix repeat-containing protein [Treponema sp.]